jgi:c-di-GMP-binding flagellar brake protein YcgR
LPEELVEVTIPQRLEGPMLWVVLGMLGLFVLAVLVVVMRRRRERMLRLRAEWQAIDTHAADKELPGKDREALLQLLRRHAPDHPLRAATVRQHFDACVDAELAGPLSGPLTPELEQRGLVLRDIRTHMGLDYLPLGQRIYSTRDLHQGQAVWMSVSGGDDAEWHRMVVAAVDEVTFRVAAAADDIPARQAPGAMPHFRIWRDEDARYTFTTPLIRIEERPSRWVFRHTTELRRTQARAHFRIHYDQTTDLGVIDAPLDEDYADLDAREPVTRLRGRITSLSGGGLAVLLPQPIPKQVLLRVELDITDGTGPMKVEVRPIEVTPLPGGRYLVRGCFVGVSDKIRESVTHFVFHEQQRLTRIAEKSE